MTQEPILVFPYDIQFTPILRHPVLLKNYSIRGLVSFEGWGFTGKDAAAADGGWPLHMPVYSSFDEVPESYDSIFFVEPAQHVDIENMLVPRMLEAVQMGKNIINTLPLSESQETMLKEQCAKHGVYFKDLRGTGNRMRFTPVRSEALLSIETPVVFVLGTTQRTNKLETQFSLLEQWSSMGYKVSLIGSRGYGDFLDVHAFPDFMLEGGLTETEKIIMFNRCLREIEASEKPDVIIIGIPGGVAVLNQQITNHFGICAYEVAQAVRPDAVVLNTFYEQYTAEYFERVSLLVKYRLGFDIDCYIISNSQLDWNASSQAYAPMYTSLSSEFIDTKLISFQSMGVPAFNILNPVSSIELGKYLLEKLDEYSEIEIV